MASRFEQLAVGYDIDAAASMSLHARAYVDPVWFEVDQRAIISRSWQWWCHVERLREPGQFLAGEVAGMPIVAVRGHDGRLRAFYNVCRHRAHELVAGAGSIRSLVCPYHAWTYDLAGQLTSARHTQDLVDFDRTSICLMPIQVAEFAGFVFVNLDPQAPSLAAQSGDLAAEIAQWAPDIDRLTFARRLTYEIASNWKNVIDNFLECYHCHVAHKDFVSLVEMDTYTVTTHGIYSSHMASAGTAGNSAYDVSDATVTDHAVWWLWPNTCLLRYPGRGNMMVLRIIPVGPGRTLETYDLFLESAEPNAAELETIRYLDEVLQVEDIALVESVQRGMRTPAFDQGRIVVDRSGSGLSEHALHHFHGLVLDAYRRDAGTPR
ncbi:MAG: ring-hydroxylating oxygenase subunit alpha [Ilumatobacteraceae bacterium]